MRIALATFGSRGDVQPYVAIHRHLTSLGHEVTLAVPEDELEFVRAFGVEALPLFFSTKSLINKAEVQDAILNHKHRLLLDMFMQHELDAKVRIEDALIDLATHSDLLVAHTIMVGKAVAVSKKTHTALHQACFFPMHDTRDHVHPLLSSKPLFAHWPFVGLGHQLSQWFLSKSTLDATTPLYERFGLPVPSVASLRRTILDTPTHLAASPALLGHPSVPTPHAITGYPFLETSIVDNANKDEQHLLDWISSEINPPVYLGFGSMPVLEQSQLLERFVHTLERHRQRAIIATHWSKIKDSKMLARLKQSPFVYLATNITHDRILPLCKGAIHHGGSGTTHACARAGIPQFILAAFADQPFWGRIIKSRGVGGWHILSDAHNRHHLFDNIFELFSSGVVQDTAKELGAQIKNEKLNITLNAVSRERS